MPTVTDAISNVAPATKVRCLLRVIMVSPRCLVITAFGGRGLSARH
jgi:hypothetical protein